jgi:hypothetical protein
MPYAPRGSSRNRRGGGDDDDDDVYHIFSNSVFTNIQSLDITVRVTDTTVINYTP